MWVDTCQGQRAHTEARREGSGFCLDVPENTFLIEFDLASEYREKNAAAEKEFKKRECL